jgi:hypothetical protein
MNGGSNQTTSYWLNLRNNLVQSKHATAEKRRKEKKGEEKKRSEKKWITRGCAWLVGVML